MNERMAHPLMTVCFTFIALAIIWGKLAPLVAELFRTLAIAGGVR